MTLEKNTEHDLWLTQSIQIVFLCQDEKLARLTTVYYSSKFLISANFSKLLYRSISKYRRNIKYFITYSTASMNKVIALVTIEVKLDFSMSY
jgi:hypothetical protein